MKFGCVLFLFATSTLCTKGDNSVAGTLEDTIMKAIETGLNGVAIVPVDEIDPDPEKCSVTSSVTCVVTATGEDCEDLVIDIDQCDSKPNPIGMTFTYRYCNEEMENDIKLINVKTTALIDTTPVTGLNYDNIPPGNCREFSISRDIDSCKRFFSSSLKVEGKRGNEEGDYCYAWDFLRIFFKRPCAVTAEISSCKVDSSLENCDDLIVPIDECTETEPMTFTFEYCNNEETPLKFRDSRFRALIETDPVTGFNLSNLQPGECRGAELPVKREINTCKQFFSSSLKVEGWRGDGIGDYCYAYDFERIFTGRPDDPPRDNTGPCEVTSSVKCFITGTDQPCDDIVVSYADCDEETDMTFEFEYCSFEDSNPINLFGGKKTISKVETVTMSELNLSMLSPGECRTLRKDRKINTCKRFFSASLKVEGRRGDDYGDYCYAYDFYRSYIERPKDNSDTVTRDCDVSAEVTCTLTTTGEDCDDIVVPRAECKTDVDMTFIFEYCSREPVHTIDLKPELTRARVETKGIPGLNLDDLQPGECRRLFSQQKIDTCKKFFSSQLKVEGARNDIGGYCYGWDFYRSYITRFTQNAPSPSAPNPSPTIDETPCAVTAKVTCTHVATGQACDDIIVPKNDCSQETPMIFVFEWCNYETSEEIVLKQEKTTALIETLPVDGALNLNNLPARKCRRRIETRNINTCKRFFSAQLKVEGLRGGRSNDYCYAFDFYRSYIQRYPDDNVPTPANAPTPQGPSETCDISAEITCIVDATGDSCENIEVDLEDCDEETDMSFTFKFCNHESESFIDLKKDLTTAMIETRDINEFDRSNMGAGECRTFTETKKINTCKRFFSASLKVEGLRDGVINDYCYAWDFYRVFFQRPNEEDTDCEITAKISCVHDESGEACENLVIAERDCKNMDIVTFDFEYCNYDTELDVVLRKDKTIALVDTISVDDMDKTNLIPGECRTLSVKRNVNTCNRFFSAGLKVEGKRPDADGYCFAYDHYRPYIKRVPTLSPSTSPSGSPSISVIPTNAPTACAVNREERRTRITKIIALISDAVDLENTDSPQSKAKNWMLEVDEYDVFCANTCSKFPFGAGVFQRYTMAVFYFATNGDNWKTCGQNSGTCTPSISQNSGDIEVYEDNELWLSNVSECLWGGLACKTATNCLDRIEIEANNVSGTIPHEIEQLNGLRFLYLEGANTIEDYESDDTLKFLSGMIPPKIRELEELLVIDLNFNKLTGPIPEGIYNLKKLRTLDINHNLLSGSISPYIGQLTKMRFLQLNNNEFTGTLPALLNGNKIWKNFVNLRNADFHSNNFTGMVPPGICQLLNIGFNLNRLSADCGDTEISCECCTKCFTDGVDNVL